VRAWQTLSGTWVASRIGGRLAGALVTLLLAAALAFNLSMLPYVMWFKVAMPAAFFVACLLGIRTGTRRLLTVPSAAARR